MNSEFNDLLNKVTEYSMNHFENEYKKGSWGKGLLLYGLIAKILYDSDKKALDFARNWVIQSIETQTNKGELSSGDPSQTNFALIGLSALFFAKLEQECIQFTNGARKQADYFIEQPLKRTDKGAIYYLKNVPQVWVDTEIMISPFLAKAGTFFNISKYTEESIKQLLLHIEYLRDPETGLYRHIWDEKQKKFYEGTLWGRGNGWMLASLVEVVEQLSSTDPKRNRLIQEIQRLAQSLILCQDSTGFWRLFLDDVSENSKIETSGTLIIAYGLSKAIRNEWINIEFAEYVQNAFDAVLTCVNKEGMIINASGPTIDPKFTPYNKPYPHAQGFFLITATEIIKLIQFLKEKKII